LVRGLSRSCAWHRARKIYRQRPSPQTSRREPIIVIMMLLAAREDIMGPFVIRLRLRQRGWAATAVMAFTMVAMFATL
jgi:hypothetical protein